MPNDLTPQFSWLDLNACHWINPSADQLPRFFRIIEKLQQTEQGALVAT